MSNALKITDAELEVMNVIWERAPITGSDVAKALSETTDWKPNTVLTLINRLVKKDILTYEKQGKSHLYSPLISKEECIEEFGTSFLEQFFDGSLMPMLTHFTGKKTLTKAEKEELKKLLDAED